jgi:HPr kinase/phosphorylase
MSETVHASAVAWEGRALLVRGKSGSGKSALSLALMAMGCDLVGDDRVTLQEEGGQLFAAPVPTITGLIEARGVGILHAAHVERARVVCVVNLDHVETDRLPENRSITLLGCQLPLIYRVEGPHWPASLLQLLKAGWSDR